MYYQAHPICSAGDWWVTSLQTVPEEGDPGTCPQVLSRSHGWADRSHAIHRTLEGAYQGVQWEEAMDVKLVEESQNNGQRMWCECGWGGMQRVCWPVSLQGLKQGITAALREKPSRSLRQQKEVVDNKMGTMGGTALPGHNLGPIGSPARSPGWEHVMCENHWRWQKNAKLLSELVSLLNLHKLYVQSCEASAIICLVLQFCQHAEI